MPTFVAVAAVMSSVLTMGSPPAVSQALGQEAPHALAGVIDGAVTDSTLSPVDGATITVFQTSVRVTTGASGRFRIQQIPAGQYLLIVQRIGFRPVSGIIEVVPNDTVRLSYTLDRAVVELAPTVVTEKHLSMRLAEFESRRRLGEGQFITQEEIDRHPSVYLTELVRNFNGVYLMPQKGSMQYVAMSTRMGGCPLLVFVDGQRQRPLVDLDLLPPPSDIMGIEAYLGPGSVPLQYAGSGAGCGALLIWTRGG